MVTALRILSGLALFYLLGMAVLATRSRRPGARPVRPLRYAFLIPCRNEELVLDATLSGLPADRARVIVIDDGSVDATAAIAAGWADRGVELVRRSAPDAGVGKGAALNAGYRHLMATMPAGRATEDIVVAVLDADGRLGFDAIGVVDSLLAEESVGAVQLGVRIANRRGVLTRFQDLEFVGFSYLMQGARHHLGTVGLGGNGQFTRLAALASLGEEPWNDGLTEDLDLGLRLAITGWRVAFGADAMVEQQGVPNLAALIRQRARWLRGHMQCWRRLPELFRAHLPLLRLLDLLAYLATPAILVAASVLVSIVAGQAALALVFGAAGILDGTRPDPPGLSTLVWGYVAAMIPGAVLAWVYHRRAGDVSRWRSLLLAHGLVVYNAVWYLAAWQAVAAIVTRRRGWTKTARVAETIIARNPYEHAVPGHQRPLTGDRQEITG